MGNGGAFRCFFLIFEYSGTGSPLFDEVIFVITPMDIHNKDFSKGIRGYAPDEVDSFLQDLVSDYEQIYREHREMEEEMETLKAKLSNYEKMEETMHNTLRLAKDTAESVKKNAQKEAKLAIERAEAESRRILSDAETYQRDTARSITRTEGDLKLYIEKIKSDLEHTLSMIHTIEAQKAPELPVVEEKADEEEEIAPVLTPDTNPNDEFAEAEHEAAEDAEEETKEETPAEDTAAEADTKDAADTQDSETEK